MSENTATGTTGQKRASQADGSSSQPASILDFMPNRPQSQLMNGVHQTTSGGGSSAPITDPPSQGGLDKPPESPRRSTRPRKECSYFELDNLPVTKKAKIGGCEKRPPSKSQLNSNNKEEQPSAHAAGESAVSKIWQANVKEDIQSLNSRVEILEGFDLGFVLSGEDLDTVKSMIAEKEKEIMANVQDQVSNCKQEAAEYAETVMQDMYIDIQNSHNAEIVKLKNDNSLFICRTDTPNQDNTDLKP